MRAGSASSSNITGAISNLLESNLEPNLLLVTDADGKIATSSITVDIINNTTATDSYTKLETNNLLNSKRNSTESYTITETNTALNGKLNIADAYTKTTVNTLLADKLNTDDGYTKTVLDGLLADKRNTADGYSSTQVNLLLDGKQDTMTNNTGLAGNVMFEPSQNKIKRLYTNAPLTSYSYLNFGDSEDIDNYNIFVDLNQSAMGDIVCTSIDTNLIGNSLTQINGLISDYGYSKSSIDTIVSGAALVNGDNDFGIQLLNGNQIKTISATNGLSMFPDSFNNVIIGAPNLEDDITSIKAVFEPLTTNSRINISNGSSIQFKNAVNSETIAGVYADTFEIYKPILLSAPIQGGSENAPYTKDETDSLLTTLDNRINSLLAAINTHTGSINTLTNSLNTKQDNIIWTSGVMTISTTTAFTTKVYQGITIRSSYTTIPIPNSPFTAAPAVYISQKSGSSGLSQDILRVHVHNPSINTFYVNATDISGSGSSAVFDWFAIQF